MRTTLSIDDDVLAAVQERARREKRTAGQVLSDLARRSLTHTASPVPASSAVHGFSPLPARGGTVTNALIDELREDED